MKSFLWFVCLAGVFSLSAQEKAPVIPSADQPQSVEADWWKQRHGALTKFLKENPCDLLFVGDSITQGWEGAGKAVWEKTFAPFHPANFGISGDRTEQVLWRMEDSKLETPHAPKMCVIHIGTNNTGHYKTKQTPEETAKGIAAIAKGLTDKFPKMEVVLLHIFPRGATKDDAMRIHNEKINVLLDKLKMKNVKVVNINKVFLNEDGTFKPGLSGDLLHFTPQGYEVWAEALIPYLKKTFPGIGKKAPAEKKIPAKA